MIDIHLPIYQLDPRSIAASSYAPRRFVNRLSFTGLDASRELQMPNIGGVNVPVPNDSLLVVTTIVLQGFAGGAQTTLSLRASILATGPSTQIVADIQQVLPGVGGAPNSAALNWQGEVVLLPGELVDMNINYNAAAVNNTSIFSIIGFYVPRANVQFG